MGKVVDLAGRRFGRLTAIECVGRRNRSALWRCKCDCGNITFVTNGNLTYGSVQSCGCYEKDMSFQKNKKFNTFRICGDIVRVKMSNTENEMLADLDVWDSMKMYCWRECHGYATTNIHLSSGKRKSVRFHVMAFPDCPTNMVRDHIDGNKLNNTRRNIRFITNIDNFKNRGLSKANTSGYPGVFWYKTNKKWIAYITVKRKRIYLGSFATVDEAIESRKEAEVMYFGEYRRKL